MSGLVEGEAILGLQYTEAGDRPPPQNLPGDGKADDAAAYYRDITLPGWWIG